MSERVVICSLEAKSALKDSGLVSEAVEPLDLVLLKNKAVVFKSKQSIEEIPCSVVFLKKDLKDAERQLQAATGRSFKVYDFDGEIKQTLETIQHLTGENRRSLSVYHSAGHEDQMGGAFMLAQASHAYDRVVEESEKLLTKLSGEKAADPFAM